MKSQQEIHEEAMSLADRADQLRQKDASAAALLYAQAMAKELEALRRFPSPTGLSWAVLLRSTVSLALDAGDHEQARLLLQEGLSSALPHEIRLELEELQRQASETPPAASPSSARVA